MNGARTSNGGLILLLYAPVNCCKSVGLTLAGPGISESDQLEWLQTPATGDSLQLLSPYTLQ